MGAMPTEYYERRHNLAHALMVARVISADASTPPLLSFNLGASSLTETLAVSLAHCMLRIIEMENLSFDVIGCISPSEPFAKVLARLVGKNGKRCLFFERGGYAKKLYISALERLLEINTRNVLLVSGYTLDANLEIEAIQLLPQIGMNVSDAITFVDLDQGARSELEKWNCTLHPIFSANEVRDMYIARRSRALSA